MYLNSKSNTGYNMKHRFNDLINIDEELFQLASYEASKGLIPILNTSEEVGALRRKASEIFNEYKLGIQRGSFDLHYVRNRVSKYCAIPSKYQSNEEQYDALLNGEDTDIIGNDDELYAELLAKYSQASKDLKKISEQGIESLGSMLKEFISSEAEDKEEILPLDELDESDKYSDFYDNNDNDEEDGGVE